MSGRTVLKSAEGGGEELSDDLTIPRAHMPLSDDGAALRLKDDDDVAVALRPLAPNAVVRFGAAGVSLVSEIPTGHKFATRPIAEGALIRKYGQVIGKASAAIAAGEHVHVHNVEGTRGRGDLAEAAR
jgi:altronate dehydratase